MATSTLRPTGLLRAVAEGGAPCDWTDADLLARFAAGRRGPDDLGALAFEVLVRRHGPMVRGVCRRILLDPGDADDAFQATFLVLVRRAGAIRVGDSLAPWLHGVARRVALRTRLDRDRRRRREGTNAGAVPDRPAPEATDPRLAEVLATLDAEVARLPATLRSALALCDLGGRTIEQAARESGCPPGTIKSRLHRARSRLKRQLARRGFGGSSANPAGLGILIPPPDRLVAAVVARGAGATGLGPIRSLFPWPFLLDGASRMTSLMTIRWVAAATLSGALGVLGTTFLGPTPGQAPPARDAAQAPAEPTGPAPASRTTPGEFGKVSLPEYVVEPPDILDVEVFEALPGRPIKGEHLIRPDGRISLGYYGEVHVAGLTVTEAKAAIVRHLREYLGDATLGLKSVAPDGREETVEPAKSNRASVNVTAYNSKVYYVQGNVGTPGRLPITGNETILDALNYAGGLAASSRQPAITLIRPIRPGNPDLLKLPADLDAILRGDTRTNYQVMPGDRVIVQGDPPRVEEVGVGKDILDHLRRQDERLDALEKKLDRILEQLDAPTRPAGK